MGALLDVGGSSGVYATEVLRDRPTARAAVFERSPVDAAARILLRTRGMSNRIEVISGDMFTDPLPRGFDIHLYSQVLHDWDDPRVEQLLSASFASLPPGGWLVDHDAHIAADKRGPLPVAQYSVLLMHSTPGKCWSVAELAGIPLRSSGRRSGHTGHSSGSRPATRGRALTFVRSPTTCRRDRR